MKKQPVFIGSNMIIKKSMWEKVRNDLCMSEKMVHEDTDLALHIKQAGGRTYFDKSLTVDVSGRRIKKNPFSFFVEYTVRNLRTLHMH